MNGTIERTMTFVFGGTSGTHSTEAWESISGSYHRSCIEAWSTHWAGDRSQPGDFVPECAVR